MAHAFALSGSNLISFDTSNPAAGASTAITGIQSGETLVDIDFRPQNGLLYALGVNPSADTATLYVISTRTGSASVVGTAGSIGFVTGASTTVDLPDPAFTGWGIDFNPSFDTLRVVVGSLSFRVDPNTGLPIDGDFGGSGISGINPDGPINGSTTSVDDAAFTNDQPNNGNITTQYTLDGTSNSLFIQSSPNSGTQSSSHTITVGGSTLDFTSINGFDIPAGVNAASNNAAASGSGYAALTVGGTTALYSVDLSNGQAIFLGNILNGAQQVTGLAIQSDLGGIPAIGLSADGASLLRFNTGAPGTVTTQSIATGSLAAGETLVALDFRPQTGQLYGLGVNATSDTATLYLINPQNGALTIVGSAGQIAFTTNGTTAVDLPDHAVAAYGFDFDPATDTIRVTTTTGLDFRINPSTGAPIDGDNGGATTAGINPDGAINGGASGVAAAAYTNSYARDLATTGPTTLYTLDPASDTLFIQSPPNSGTQTAAHVVKLGGATLDFTGVAGFDIAPGVSVTTDGAVASGVGYAALTVAGVTSLYQIDLATGAAIDLGAIAAGATALAGLTLANAQSAPAITSDGAGTSASKLVVENTTAVTTVTAYDGDFDQVRFTITGGADAAKFSINASTGALSFLAAPNFEAPGDADANNSYVVQVTASDGSHTGTQTLTVQVTNQNEAPVITSSASVSIAENHTDVMTVTATDVDGPSLSYAIVGGADAAKFHIDAATGALSFVTAPNYEQPTDADHNNSYLVQVRASDGSLSDTQAITVTVTDVNEVYNLGPGDSSFPAPSGESFINGERGTDAVQFFFNLVDARISFAGTTIIVDGPDGSHAVLTGVEVFRFNDGTVNNRDGNPLVDDLYYYANNHDVWTAHVDADAHFAAMGWKEGRDPNAFFDTKGYLAHYTDVAAAGINPLTHYDQNGWQEGRDPSTAFDTKAYLAHYPDVAATHVDPLAHFLTWGSEESRLPYGDGVWG
jgi:hypothetical protein